MLRPLDKAYRNLPDSINGVVKYSVEPILILKYTDGEDQGQSLQ